jgi:hypothetical protein
MQKQKPLLVIKASPAIVIAFVVLTAIVSVVLVRTPGNLDIVLALWLIVGMVAVWIFAYRLALHENDLEYRTVFRTKRLAYDDITQIKWQTINRYRAHGVRFYIYARSLPRPLRLVSRPFDALDLSKAETVIMQHNPSIKRLSASVDRTSR